MKDGATTPSCCWNIVALRTAGTFRRGGRTFAARKAAVVGCARPKVASIFVRTLGADGSIGGIVEKMLKTTAQRRRDQAYKVTHERRALPHRLDAMRKHRKIYADPSASYGIMMDRLYSIEIESAADLAYASYVIEHGMLDASPWRKSV
jgi:hypothetical protein